MGGFSFGSINDLDPLITLYCFIGVVCFIIFFDHLSGVVEFLLERSPLYNRMLQSIYKELMLMGLVSFSVIMYNASVPPEDSTDDHSSSSYDSTDKHSISLFATSGGDSSHSSVSSKIILSIDFAHILLFYVTLFFVLHAFYLMGLSILFENKYHRLAGEQINALIDRIQRLSLRSKIWKWLFEWEYWPFSSLRQHVEYHLLKDVFHKTYLLSLNFDFASYLSLCFGRYALKSINRGLVTWFVLVILLIVNYCRVFTPFACAHSHLKHDTVIHDTIVCDEYTIRLFLAGGVLLGAYFLVLVFVSNVYKRRLLSHGDVKKPSEYVDYLKQKQQSKLTNVMTDELKDLERYHNRELKHDIEHEFHSQEKHGDDEEPGIEFLANGLVSLTKFCGETISYLRLRIRLFFVGVFCGNRLTKANESGSLLILSSNKDNTGGNPNGKKIVKRRSSIAEFFHHATENPRKSWNHSTIKKAEHIPLRHKLSVRFIHHQRQSVVLINAMNESRQNSDVHLTHNTPTPPPPLATGERSPVPEEKTDVTNSGNAKSDDASASPEEIRSGEHLPVGDCPTKRVSFARLTSLNKVIPEEEEQRLTTTHLSETHAKSQLQDLKKNYEAADSDIRSIFFLRNPQLYFSCIEIGLMLVCVYTAIWATNMISLIPHAHYSRAWSDIIHIFMIIPIVWCLFCILYVAEIASMLLAMTELKLSAVHDVLVEMEVTEQVVEELRTRFKEILHENCDGTITQDEFINKIFDEIDEDGSGFIDRDEFRSLLRKLEITFNNYRFKLLYRMIDACNDGLISREDFKNFLVPPESNISIIRPRFTSEDYDLSRGHGNGGGNSGRGGNRLHTVGSDDRSPTNRPKYAAIREVVSEISEEVPEKGIIMVSDVNNMETEIISNSVKPFRAESIKSALSEKSEDETPLGLTLENDQPIDV